MIICIIAAICSFLYGVIVWRANSGTHFFLIWFILAGCAAGTAWLLSGDGWHRLPQPVRMAGMAVILAGLTVFFCVELCVLSCFWKPVPDDLDVLVVLGAQVRKNGPTRTLRYRLDEAYTYLSAHPDTRCIVSGGKGSNEPDSEAQVMYQYLAEKGVAKNRIVCEDQSVNTMENLQNSQAFLKKEEERVGIVTSNFHLFRSLHLAKRQGYRNAFGIPSRSAGLFLVNNMVREFFGLGKDFLMGNLA